MTTTSAPNPIYKPRWLTGTGEGGAGCAIGMGCAADAGRGTGVLLPMVAAAEAVRIFGEAAAVTAVRELSCEPCTKVLSNFMDAKARCIACRNSSADWKRCSGALAMDLRTTSFTMLGNPGLKSMGGGGAWLMWAAMIEKLLSDSNGLLPVTIS